MLILQSNATATWVQIAFSAVLAVATVILAWVTWKYANEAKAQTTEMEKTRKANFRPVLKATIERYMIPHNLKYLYRVRVTNTGVGAAHSVTADLCFSDSGTKREWTTPLITPGEERQLGFPNGESGESLAAIEELEDSLSDSTNLHFEAEYTDPLGNEYETEEDIDVLNVVHSLEGEMDEIDELSRIRSELEDVNRNLKE